MKAQKLILGIGLMLLCSTLFVFCPSTVFAQAQKPIVFALIEPFSGPFKDVGMEVATYVEYGVQQINAAGGIMGRQVKLMQYDNQLKPDISVRQARKAVQEDGAIVIMNHTSSAVGLALAKVAKELNIIHIVFHAEADEITGSQFETNTFRTCLSTSMHSGILASYFAQSPHKRFYLINQDYAFGHAVADSFKKAFLKVKRADQEIVGDDYHPMATKDFGPYVTKAIAAKPDVIITGNFGPDYPGLMKQARALGLKAVFGTYYSDPTYMFQTKDAAIGTVTAEMYLATLKSKKNQDFVKTWQAWLKKNHPNSPSFYVVPSALTICIDGLGFVAEAIKKANSTDPAKIIVAWEGMSYEGIAGKVTMRACDHQIQPSGYIGIVQANHPFKAIVDFPYVGDPIVIPIEKFAVPPKETGNARCK